MADDDGFNALKARVAAARATAAGSVRVPQLPPDESAAPWATSRPPTPQKAVTAVESRLPSYEEVMGIKVVAPPPTERMAVKKPPARMVGRQPQESPTEAAWKLIDKLMQRWADTSKENLGRANSWLSQQWARNSTFFIRNNLPLDKFEEVIKVCVSLAKDNLGELEEDKRIEEIRQRGMRELSDFAGDDEEESGGEDDA